MAVFPTRSHPNSQFPTNRNISTRDAAPDPALSFHARSSKNRETHSTRNSRDALAVLLLPHAPTAPPHDNPPPPLEPPCQAPVHPARPETPQLRSFFELPRAARRADIGPARSGRAGSRRHRTASYVRTYVLACSLALLACDAAGRRSDDDVHGAAAAAVCWREARTHGCLASRARRASGGSPV